MPENLRAKPLEALGDRITDFRQSPTIAKRRSLIKDHPSMASEVRQFWAGRSPRERISEEILSVRHERLGQVLEGQGSYGGSIALTDFIPLDNDRAWAVGDALAGGEFRGNESTYLVVDYKNTPEERTTRIRSRYAEVTVNLDAGHGINFSTTIRPSNWNEYDSNLIGEAKKALGETAHPQTRNIHGRQEAMGDLGSIVMLYDSIEKAVKRGELKDLQQPESSSKEVSLVEGNSSTL